MQAITIPRTRLTRRATLALCAAGLASRPAGVRADHDGT